MHPALLYRAADGIRTRDPHLGKVARYRCATTTCARDPLGNLGPLPEQEAQAAGRGRERTTGFEPAAFTLGG